jgi:ATP-binding cassette, subfamily B, bacterial
MAEKSDREMERAIPTDHALKRNKPKKTRLLPVYLWTLSFLKPYLWLFIGLLVCTLCLSAIELLIPKFIQKFIDDILPRQDTGLFLRMLLGLAGLIGVMLLFDAVANLWRRTVQEKSARDLQFTVFRHLRALGFSYFEKHPVGESLALINSEVANVQKLYRQLLPWMIHQFLFSTAAYIFMAMISPQLTLITIPCFLLYYIAGPYFERKSAYYGREFTEKRVQLNQKAYESISALTELRAQSAEGWDFARFLQKQQEFNRSFSLMWIYTQVRGAVRRFSYHAGSIVIFVYGYWLLRHGMLSVGEMTAFLLYYFTAMHRLTMVVTTITEQRVLMYQAEKLYRFMQLKPEVEELKQPAAVSEIRGEIEFDNVSFHYLEDQPILNRLNLRIQPGERIAIVGTSGNGKSTLVKLLGRFYDPQQGTIRLDGIPLQHLSFADLRGTLGFVFQETYLFGSTVKENIRFGKPEATDDEVIEAAKLAYAHEFIQQLPQGYETLVGERGIKLSGGQKQRISLARMFVKNPRVLLLDEATSALDNTSEKEVHLALEQLCHGRTTILVAHRLSTVKDADRILVMDNGRVAEEGSYAELMERNGLFRKLSEGDGGSAYERAFDVA